MKTVAFLLLLIPLLSPPPLLAQLIALDADVNCPLPGDTFAVDLLVRDTGPVSMLSANVVLDSPYVATGLVLPPGGINLGNSVGTYLELRIHFSTCYTPDDDTPLVQINLTTSGVAESLMRFSGAPEFQDCNMNTTLFAQGNGDWICLTGANGPSSWGPVKAYFRAGG